MRNIFAGFFWKNEGVWYGLMPFRQCQWFWKIEESEEDMYDHDPQSRVLFSDESGFGFLRRVNCYQFALAGPPCSISRSLSVCALIRPAARSSTDQATGCMPENGLLASIWWASATAVLVVFAGVRYACGKRLVFFENISATSKPLSPAC